MLQDILPLQERLWSCNTGQITVHTQFFSVVTWSFWMPNVGFISGSTAGGPVPVVPPSTAVMRACVHLFLCRYKARETGEEERWSTTEENNCTSTGPRGSYETWTKLNGYRLVGVWTEEKRKQ